mmetsp:Transcript_546/g.1412  ORF Transcript_546/g.1412 Transcript_546/m.1412 type:complete len:209 (-) Transcript_546:154-780(-)
MGVNDMVDEPELARLVGAHSLAGEHHVERRLCSHQPRQPLRPARARQQTEHHLGQRKLRLGTRACHTRMARERHLEAAAHARAVDRGDHGQLARRDAVHDPLPCSRQLSRLLRARARGKHLDVRARDEVVRLGRDDDGRAHGGVALDGVEGGLELGHQLLIERVHLLPLRVEPQVRDRVHHVHAHISAGRRRRRSASWQLPARPRHHA